MPEWDLLLGFTVYRRQRDVVKEQNVGDPVDLQLILYTVLNPTRRFLVSKLPLLLPLGEVTRPTSHSTRVVFHFFLCFIVFHLVFHKSSMDVVSYLSFRHIRDPKADMSTFIA